eukprot:scaffold446281_cov21-Prasinocladus_malaysianus.AAC.1
MTFEAQHLQHWRAGKSSHRNGSQIVLDAVESLEFTIFSYVTAEQKTYLKYEPTNLQYDLSANV